ncbi:MAG: tyrosine recombinase [Clostridia bacterium]|nr:tyrosine recombinase [Clostridia bacterium]
MENSIRIFNSYLINEKKSSNNTVESYMRDIIQFSDFCTSNNISNVKDVNKPVIENYLKYLTAVGKSESTKLRTIATLRAFFRCLTAKGFFEGNPLDGISVKKTEKQLPGVLDEKEIVLLLSQPNGVDFKSIRDKAMLEILYATGIKVSELIELKTGDINLQIGILHLKNGKKERIVPIYPAAIRSVANYLVNVRPAIVLEESEDKLFTNMNGKPMSRQGFWKIIKHYADTAGIKKDITPHTLRHSFATHLLENGATLSDIKEMLGHSDISSTQIYAQLIKSKYTSAYTKFHPMANK